MSSEDRLQEALDNLDVEAEPPLDGLSGGDPALLETARWLTSARPTLEPRPGFVRASRRRVQARIGPRVVRNPWRVWGGSALYWWQSPTLHVAMVVLLAAALYFNAVSFLQASRYWLPGDTLYPLKPVAENVRLLVSFAPERDAALHIEFAHRRLIEVQALVFENRYEEIPGAVASFDYHVTRAVTLVNQVADYEQGQARGLATDLQNTLAGQMGLVALLADFTPDAAQPQFERLLMISTGGVMDMQELLPPDSGDTQIMGYHFASPGRG